MEIFALDLADIAALATEVALNGALQVSGWDGDGLFEMTVSITAVIVELTPG